jgi:hypothetical protein
VWRELEDEQGDHPCECYRFAGDDDDDEPLGNCEIDSQVNDMSNRIEYLTEQLAAAEALLREIVEDHRRYRGLVTVELIERAKEVCDGKV